VAPVIEVAWLAGFFCDLMREKRSVCVGRPRARSDPFQVSLASWSPVTGPVHDPQVDGRAGAARCRVRAGKSSGGYSEAGSTCMAGASHRPVHGRASGAAERTLRCTQRRLSGSSWNHRQPGSSGGRPCCEDSRPRGWRGVPLGSMAVGEAAARVRSATGVRSATDSEAMRM
jgi:hypothetical protein